MWLIYALGGGWGHLTRAVSLARIAQRHRPVRIVTSSPYAPIVAESMPELDLVGSLAGCRPSCLIVDTFPRGLGGELADLLPTISAPKVLIHRDLNPQYVEAKGVREFVSSNYDLVLVPGPGEGGQFGGVETEPWLVRSAEELTQSEGQGVLVCASGKPEELAWYGEVTAVLVRMGVPVRCVAAECPPGCPQECWVRYWPAIDLMGSARVVVGGAGYNTVQECRAWGLPLVARAWPRMYDRQERRARLHGVTLVSHPEDAARQAVARMGGPPGRPEYVNGAAQAVEILSRAICGPSACGRDCAR